MVNPTAAQLRFLKHHNIPLRRTFDATWLPTKGGFRSVMKARDLWIAYNTNPCWNDHELRLRDRNGNCVGCDLSKITRVRQNSEKGTVYIAYSPSSRLVKIGVCNIGRSAKRVRDLSTTEGYGGQEDWELAAGWDTYGPGKVQASALKNLRRYQGPERTYLKHGVRTKCSELLRCKVETAQKAIESALKKQ
jgi:hypothetical protein